MRPWKLALVVAALAAAAGCFGRSAEYSPGDDSAGDDDGLGPTPTCSIDGECVAAGETCCACPTYAVPIGSEWPQACEDIDCPPPESMDCSSLVPRCLDGTCALACPLRSCDASCPDGFMADADGCLTCTCATVSTVNECTRNDQCARVPADCCGCELGGMDTSVPVDEVETHLAGLGCSPDPSCPGVNVCVAGLAPRCDRGECVLDTGPGPLPPNACGRDDLPACPPGQTCVVNSDADATMEGVGICQ